MVPIGPELGPGGAAVSAASIHLVQGIAVEPEPKQAQKNNKKFKNDQIKHQKLSAS